jgi:hypothetical protein
MTHVENSTNQTVAVMSGAVKYDAVRRFVAIERNKNLIVEKIVHMGDPNNRRAAAAQWFKSRNSH